MADTTMLDMVRTTVAQQIEQANALVEQINAATTDRSKLVHEVRTDPETTDEKVKAHQAWIEKAQAAIEDAIKQANEYITATYFSEDPENKVDAEALKEQYKELRTGIKNALGFVATLPGYDAEKFEVPELKNLRGGTSGSSGSGGKRPRLTYIKVNGALVEKVTQNKNGEDVHTSNFTLAAAEISKQAKAKVEVKDLQAAAFEAAKTDDLSTVAGQEISFNYSAGDKTFEVALMPKSPDEGSTSEAPTTEAETPAAE